MKKNNKKGFTIVELVIVIAVIGILAAVLIPTFGGIIEKANKSAVEQEAHALFKEVYALDIADGLLDGEEGETAINKDGVTYSASTTDGTQSYTFTYKDTDRGYQITNNNGTWGQVEDAN